MVGFGADNKKCVYYSWDDRILKHKILRRQIISSYFTINMTHNNEIHSRGEVK